MIEISIFLSAPSPPPRIVNYFIFLVDILHRYGIILNELSGCAHSILSLIRGRFLYAVSDSGMQNHQVRRTDFETRKDERYDSLRHVCSFNCRRRFY